MSEEETSTSHQLSGKVTRALGRKYPSGNGIAGKPSWPRSHPPQVTPVFWVISLKQLNKNWNKKFNSYWACLPKRMNGLRPWKKSFN